MWLRGALFGGSVLSVALGQEEANVPTTRMSPMVISFDSFRPFRMVSTAFRGGQEEPSAMNRMGQFASSEAFADAMSKQLRIPYPIAFRFAEMQRLQAQQTLAFNAAISDWLGSLEAQIPDPAQVADPIARGLSNARREALEEPSVSPQVQAALPLITSAADGVMAVLGAAYRFPVDAFLETPRHEMKDLNDLIMATSPIQLTPPQPINYE